ncbi:hypothetical protein Clacol_010279 [Clathrus columnatus]|uniref:Uncharacterized protein n=1 Tax=Clathrus columnatus TaxID=1419009 RepID=A0AAV5AVT9_9AGAM|nr:hypothetical protein Clacol_010279 [Clathrus columnatus]
MWGGTRFAWSFPQTLIPLIVGALGLVFSIYYEARFASQPSFLGGVATLELGLISIPIFGISQGVYIQKTGSYLPINLIGYVIGVMGTGLLISLKVTSPFALIALYQVIIGCGLGLTSATTAWGVAIGGTILQNELQKGLPEGVLKSLPKGTQVAFSLILKIKDLPPEGATQVKEVFTQSLRGVWISATAFVGAGLLVVLGLKNVPLRKTVDAKWGIDRDDNQNTNNDYISL